MTTAIAGFALLFVTGRAVCRMLRIDLSRDPISSAAVDLGIGLSIWPLLLLWTSLAGIRLEVVSVRLIFAVLLLLVAVDEFSRFRRDSASPFRSHRWSTWVPFAAIAIAACWTRVLHIRDLALPAWVDSIHHTMIVRLIVKQGSLPLTYEPYIPSSDFYYHWGYHAVMSSVTWLTGQTDPFQISRAMLDFGQLLNVLTIFSMYAAGRALFRSPRAGLWSAALATLVSFFPAYYVSWGRYTHLSGTILLPLLPIVVARIRIRKPGSVVCAAILASGLALIHVRLAFFAGTALLVLAATRLLHRTFFRRLGAWSVFALLTLVLAGPWIFRLARNPYVHHILSPPAATATDWETPTSVRTDLAWAPRNRELLILGTGGIAGLALWGQLGTGWRALSVGLWIAAMLLSELAHRRRRQLRSLWKGVSALGAWAIVTAIALNLQVIGFPRLRIASNTSAVITLFVPLCLCLGGVISVSTSTLLVRPRRIAMATTSAIIALATTAIFTFRDVVNPQTVLASQADVRAMRWIAQHTPQDSVFMVRSRTWLGRSRMGIDGGAWIQVLTDRGSILLPGLYPWVTSEETVEKTEMTLRDFADAPSMSDDELHGLLAGAGVTHVYFGDSDQGISPAALSERPFSRLVYEDGRVQIYELVKG